MQYDSLLLVAADDMVGRASKITEDNTVVIFSIDWFLHKYVGMVCKEDDFIRGIIDYSNY